MKKNAFTLAETLVMMAIVGIIAVVTVSGYQKIRPNKDMFMLKKAYDTLSNTVASLANDDILYPEILSVTDSLDSDVKIPVLASKGHLFLNTNVHEGGLYKPYNKFAYNFAQKLSTAAPAQCMDSQCKFKTTDGIFWTVTDKFDTDEAIAIVDVDINSDKIPNADYTESQTPDRFKFIVDSSGRIYLNSDDIIEKKYLETRKSR